MDPMPTGGHRPTVDVVGAPPLPSDGWRRPHGVAPTTSILSDAPHVQRESHDLSWGWSNLENNLTQKVKAGSQRKTLPTSGWTFQLSTMSKIEPALSAPTYWEQYKNYMLPVKMWPAVGPSTAPSSAHDAMLRSSVPNPGASNRSRLNREDRSEEASVRPRWCRRTRRSARLGRALRDPTAFWSAHPALRQQLQA